MNELICIYVKYITYTMKSSNWNTTVWEIDFSATSLFVLRQVKIKRVKNRFASKENKKKKKKILSFPGIRSINKRRRGLRTLSEIVISEEETERVMCCDLLWKEVSTIEIFLLFFPCCLFESVRFPSVQKIEEKRHRNISSGQQTQTLNRFSIPRPDRKFSISSATTTFHHVLRGWTQLSSPKRKDFLKQS